MSSLVYTVGIFLVIFILHSVLHQILKLFGVVTFKSMVVYVLGFLPLIILWKEGFLVIPMSSCIFYILLVFVVAPYYLAVTLEGETPAAMILKAFSLKKMWTVKELISLFTVQGLLWDRINKLESTGLIRKRKEHFIATSNGLRVVAWIEWYRKLFHRSVSG